jgi:phosphatidylserine/phosphatidylglycerophosphate/cardiolipin synthase-like enzyme
MLIVQGDAGLIAFIGGMDFMPNRVDVAPDRGEPWSDVQLRLVGPAADDVRLVFEQRWIDHPATRPLDEKLGLSSTASSEQRRAFAFPAPRPPSARAFETVTSAADSPRQAQRQAIAVGRTFGRAMKGDPPVYSFAPNGDYSAWSLIEAGIQRAVRWIYVEDQYLVSRMGRQALLAKLKEPNFEFLLMLMSNTGSVGGEFKYLATARNEFRRDLLALDPQKKKWGLYTLVKPPDPARQAWCGSFVHSKTWIFDDGYAIVGSANFDDRGYTLDSEVVAGVSQSNDIDLWVGKTFAIDLRTRLWAKYLGLPHAMVSHFRKGLTHWKSPPPGAMVYESSEYDDDPLYNPPSHFPPNADAKAKYEMIWKMFADPDAR